ncbi:MAG: terminase small subunit [Nitrososphaeraceae archaeon]|nr:terminase small subunit [Nitrososphaeraceae archaeon]
MGGPHRFAVGNTWGRPRDYETPEELASNVLDYFTWCEGEFKEVEVKKVNKKTGEESIRKVKECIRPPESYTITGLCLFLGFESRSTFDEQAKRSSEFSYIVKRAKMVVEQKYEKNLDSQSPTGAIFALKNMGWKDKTEQDVTMDLGITWNEEKTYEGEAE